MEQTPPTIIGSNLKTFLIQRIGRRGAFLLFLSLLDTIFAYSLLAPTAESINSTYLFITSIASIYLWAGLWGIAGILCFIFAFRQQDAIGYGAAISIKVLWALVFLMGWLTGQAPRGYLSVVIWGTFAALLYLIASWPEPQNRLVSEGN